MKTMNNYNVFSKNWDCRFQMLLGAVFKSDISELSFGNKAIPWEPQIRTEIHKVMNDFYHEAYRQSFKSIAHKIFLT